MIILFHAFFFKIKDHFPAVFKNLAGCIEHKIKIGAIPLGIFAVEQPRHIADFICFDGSAVIVKNFDRRCQLLFVAGFIRQLGLHGQFRVFQAFTQIIYALAFHRAGSDQLGRPVKNGKTLLENFRRINARSDHEKLCIAA